MPDITFDCHEYELYIGNTSEDGAAVCLRLLAPPGDPHFFRICLSQEWLEQITANVHAQLLAIFDRPLAQIHLHAGAATTPSALIQVSLKVPGQYAVSSGADTKRVLGIGQIIAALSALAMGITDYFPRVEVSLDLLDMGLVQTGYFQSTTVTHG